MTRLSRRSFLAGSVALAAAQNANFALGAVPASGEVDIAIIGAGAAGIAAARRIAAAGNTRFALLEAASQIGGRCVTEQTTFGVPYDRGAHWIHLPRSNPLLKAAGENSGLEIYAAARGQKLRVAPRNARESELEQFLSALVRSQRAILEAGRGRVDVAASSVLPADLGDWRPTIEFVLGPYSGGKDLANVSAADFARAAEREADSFCRQGYGALLARLGANIPVQLGTPVRSFDWNRGLVLDTPKGTIRARAVIVTVSTNVLAANGIGFAPDLPPRQGNAAARLSLGSYEHIALEMPGNPLALDRDDLVFEKCSGPRTGALLANIGGTSLATVDVAGAFGRDLAKAGEPAMIDFALEWLGSIFGNDVKRSVKRRSATRWSEDALALGAFSIAAPGAASARTILQEPLNDRIWFAGEAVHETLWGTVGGAWESGTRAAEAALKKIGALAPPPKAEAPRGKRQQRR